MRGIEPPNSMGDAFRYVAEVADEPPGETWMGRESRKLLSHV